MKLKGPLVTLLAGLAVALVLLVLNINATSDKKSGDSGAVANTTSAGPAATATATPAATTPAAKKQVTYAGKVNGGGATLAIALNGGQVVAYVCDGRRIESWLQGTTDGTKLALSGTNEGKLTGTYGNGIADGTVTVAGRSWTFRLSSVKPPSGLYRAAADVRNAKVVGGWVVLADGTQVGVLDQGDQAGPAPTVDLNSLTTNVDGTTVSVRPVDGSGL